MDLLSNGVCCCWSRSRHVLVLEPSLCHSLILQGFDQ